FMIRMREVSMEASREKLFGPVALPPRRRGAREPGCDIVRRIKRNATAALLLANLAGAIVTFVLGVWVVPIPHGLSRNTNLLPNVIGFAVATVIGLVAGSWLSTRASRISQGWLNEDRAPTPEERE